ncbi:hypothetical protein LZ190_21660 [Rhodovulum sulfidophilum]|nr:hypothetical protein [Rhodovulum sulfidophilum]
MQDEEVTLSPGMCRIRMNFRTPLPWKPSEDQIMASPPGCFLLELAQLIISFGGEKNYPGGAPQVTFSVKRSENGVLTDFFEVNHKNVERLPSEEVYEYIVGKVHEKLSTFLRPAAPEDGGLVPTISNLAESFNTSYQKMLFELSESISKVSAERAAQLESLQEERSRIFNEVSIERTRIIESANETISIERSKLEEEKRLLEEEWGKLEASSHKDSRRRQFAKMQDRLESSLKRPDMPWSMSIFRVLVFLAILSAGFVAAFFAYASIAAGALIDGSQTASWVFYAVKSSILTFISLSSFFGAAAWLRHFYSQDFRAHEEARKFGNDMARASWVMDAALEIRKEHNEDIPPEWLEGVTRGLFSEDGKTAGSVQEGAQALAALLGLSASATFGPSGLAVDLNKRGRKAISAALQEPE